MSISMDTSGIWMRQSKERSLIVASLCGAGMDHDTAQQVIPIIGPYFERLTLDRVKEYAVAPTPPVSAPDSLGR